MIPLKWYSWPQNGTLEVYAYKIWAREPNGVTDTQVSSACSRNNMKNVFCWWCWVKKKKQQKKHSGTLLLPRGHSRLPLTRNAPAMEIYLKVKHYQGGVNQHKGPPAFKPVCVWTLTSLGANSDHNMMGLKKNILWAMPGWLNYTTGGPQRVLKPNKGAKAEADNWGVMVSHLIGGSAN